MKLATFVFLVTLSLSCVSAKRLAEGRARGEESAGVRVLKGGKTGNDNGNPCDICRDGKPDSLRLRYELPSVTSILQGDKATCVEGDYPETAMLSVNGSGEIPLSIGTEFIITGGLETFTYFGISGWGTCSIHTSCSVPLVPGDKIGPFLIVAEDDCDPIPAAIPGECIICDENNKERPDELTLIYNSAGKNSAYQDEDRATCRESTYPSNPTTITALDKRGNVLGIFENISDGDSFTVDALSGSTLGAITNFEISGWTNDGADGNDCFIHTSCSQALAQGDQIGPFIVSAGNDCQVKSDPPTSSPSSPPTQSPTLSPTLEPTTLPPTIAPTLPRCIVADKAIYQCGENIAVTFNFDGDGPADEDPRINDWVGIYPCEVDIYKHAEVWEWTCGLPPATPVNGGCINGPVSEGVVLFDSLPDYNSFGPHVWPVAPFFTDDAKTMKNRCFKAVLVREDGPSVPPYITVCESTFFEIIENDDAGCAIRDTSPSTPAA